MIRVKDIGLVGVVNSRATDDGTDGGVSISLSVILSNTVALSSRSSGGAVVADVPNSSVRNVINMSSLIKMTVNISLNWFYRMWVRERFIQEMKMATLQERKQEQLGIAIS